MKEANKFYFSTQLFLGLSFLAEGLAKTVLIVLSLINLLIFIAFLFVDFKIEKLDYKIKLLNNEMASNRFQTIIEYLHIIAKKKNGRKS